MFFCNRRKFGTQTSDSMDRWKSRGGTSQRGEDTKGKDQRRERVRRKKMQVREKVGKSRFTAFFWWFVAPDGRKVGWLKRWVRSHVARWEMRNCTPLWREAHFQAKSAQNRQVRSTVGHSDVVLRGRRKGLCTLSKVSKTCGSCNSFNYNYTTAHYAPLHPTPLHYITLSYITLQLQLQLELQLQLQLQLHNITLHYATAAATTTTTTTTSTTTATALHYTTLH